RMTAESGEQAFLLAFGMAIILFMAILLYGINVMSSVLEEKTTRVVELLVSSLRPFELMLGKVVGAGAVGIVQLSVWAGSAVLLTGQQGRLAVLVAREGQVAGAGFQLPQVPAPTLAVFLVYFLLGYFLYSAVFAALGAVSSTEQDARQIQTPISLVLMVPYLSFIGILNDPNGPLAVWMTLIPLW
ncbi:MAG: ABC transporter permease, partial [Dehalococcoidia bacterium]